MTGLPRTPVPVPVGAIFDLGCLLLVIVPFIFAAVVGGLFAWILA